MSGILHLKSCLIISRALIALAFFFGSFTQLLAQTGPGGVGSNDGSSTLQLWLRGDSVTTTGTTTWHDRSGYDHDFIQATGGNQPAYVATEAALGNQPAFDFDGTDDFLEDADGENYINGASAVSLIVVIKSDVTDADQGIFRSVNSGNDEGLALRYDRRGSLSGNTPDHVKFGISNNRNLESSRDVQSNNGQIISALWQGGAGAQLFIDGTDNTTANDNGTASADNPISNAVFAQLGNGPSGNWDGRIAEVIYFDAQINAAQRAIIENYLNARYGITISNEYYVEASGYVHEVVGIGFDGGASHTQANSAGFILSTYDGTFDTDGEYLMAGHDNVANTTVTTSLQAGVSERWARSWYVDKTTAGAVNAALTFDLGEGFPGGQFPQEADNYVLLRRNGATYDSVEVAAKIITGDQISFRVEDTNLTDGIYTLGSTDASVSPVAGLPGRIWYSYQSGDWTNPNSWTLDGGVSPLLVNPANEYPGTSDNVVITSGRTITMDTDNESVASMEVTGRLDMATSSGHNFGEISGQGRIRMQGYDDDANGATPPIDNFPAGDATAFVAAGTGGTVELYGSGFHLDQARTFRNLVVNLTNATDVVTQLADITLNGNLTVTRGDFRINDNTATTLLDLEVLGNVLVDTDGRMSVGTADAYTDNTGGTYGDYHQGFHEMIVHGNFTNNGSVRFTNESVPDYDTRSTDGTVSLVFTGATNNNLNCNATTDLYNLVIDKGTDQTYEIELNAATQADFALFGANDGDWNNPGGNDPNPENQKALWIRNGTLRLTGNVFIPSLTEGGRDYTIGESAALVLDGPNVTVHNTANESSTWTGFSHGTPNGVNNGQGQQGLYPYGRLQVNDGYYWLGEAEAINFRDEAPGVIEVNGGELRANQIALSSGAGAGIYTFTLNGGIVRIDGEFNEDGGRAMLHLDNANAVFTMTGGELTIQDDVSGHTTNGILISSDPGNINVTGGTVRTDYAGDMEINSTAPFYNLVIETHTVDMQSDLRILNDLTISTGTTRGTAPDVYGGYLDLCPDGTTCFDLEVGRNLTIEDSGVLDVFTNAADDAGSATVTFNGTGNGIFNIGDITTYTYSLTGYDDPDNPTTSSYRNYILPLYNLVIDKGGDTLQLQAKNPGLDLTPNGALTDPGGGKNLTGNDARLLYISNGLTIASGSTLNQIDPVGGGIYGYIVRVYAPTIDIDGNLLVYEQGVNPTNSFLEVREQDPDNNPATDVGDVISINSTPGSTIGNLVLDLGNDELEIGSDLSVTRFVYRHGGVNIGTHNLRVDIFDFNTESNGDNERLRGGNGEYLLGENTSGARQYIYTDGNASDGGLSIKLPRVTNEDGTDDTDNIGNDPSYDTENDEYQNNNLVWFPIGLSDRYTPAIMYIVDDASVTYNDDEYVTVRPVAGELQTTDLSGGDILQYYWRIGHEGFDSGLPIVSWMFQYDQDDVSGAENGYVPGKVLDGGSYQRSWDGSAQAVHHNATSGNGSTNDDNENHNLLETNPGNIIIFNGLNTGTSGTPGNVPDDQINDLGGEVFTESAVNGTWNTAFPNTGFTLENANYTAGEATRFVGAPDIFYSRIVSTSYNIGGMPQWSNGNTWSLVSHTGAAAGDYPQDGDIAIIGVGGGGGGPGGPRHHVAYRATDNYTPARVEINRSTTITSWAPRLFIEEGATIDLSELAGNGTLEVRVDPASPSTITGDLGQFTANDTSGARVLFHLEGGGTGVNAVALPEITNEYPNVRIEGGGNREAYFTNSVTIRNELRVDFEATLRPRHDIHVMGNLRLGNFREGILLFPDDTEINVTVDGNLIVASDNQSAVNVENDNTNPPLTHRLIVGGNIDLNQGQRFDLWNGNGANDDNCILELQGEQDAWLTNGDNMPVQLYRLVMNKGTNATHTFWMLDNGGSEAPTFNGPSNTVDKPIEILNGILGLYDPQIDVILSSGGGDFYLPNTNNPSASSGSGGIEIGGGVARIQGDDTGLRLDGILRVWGGTLNMATGTGNGNNFIQYSASGNALLEVSAGTLDVGSHIRRSTTNTSGVLQYRQTGGTVNIGTQAAPLENRALFEVLNAGSEFTLTGGTFNILRQNGTNPSVATLLLEPETSDLSGSTINIGGTATPAGQTITINSTVPLNNVTVQTDNDPVARIRGRALDIDGTLTINTGATLDANGWALNMGGNFVNNGTFTANGNTTTFSSSAPQQVSGTATGGTTFFNLAKNGSNTLSLSAHNLTVEGDLEILQGTLDDGGNTITLRGNMLHQGTHTTPAATSGAGIAFAGNSRQELRGLTNNDIDLGKVTINNGAGVVIPDGNGYDFTINEALRLSAGVLDIGGSLLTLTANAALEEVSTFGPNNMIQTNSSFTDNGFRRNFNAISATTSLMFPVGQTYYTPVRFNIDGSSAGSLTVRPANERHPSIIEDTESPSIIDSANVLQYHWIVSASGISGFTGNAVMTYNQTTVEGNEADYIPARLYNNSTSWDKSLPATNVDQVANTIRYDWDIAVNDSEITGDYTAGLPDAIPDEVPTYITRDSGDYTASGTWTPQGSAPPVTPGVGPIGAIIVVETGHTLTFNENNIRVYRTEIRGTGVLDVAGTFGHRLGDVSGTGTLRISSNTSSAVLPAGFYTDFLSCSGGGLEYAGTGSYDILGGITSLRNLTLSGSNSRNLPANDITICNDLTLNGPTLENTDNVNITVENNFLQDNGTFNAGSGNLTVTNTLDINGGTFNGGTGNKTINGALDLATGTLNVGSDGTFTVLGNVTNTGGTFDGGSGSAVFVLGGSTAQTVSGTFTGGAAFHRLRINNAAGVSFSGAVDVDQELDLSNGIVTTNGNDFTLTQASTTVSGGGPSAYINGQLRKVMDSGDDFEFPVGKSNRYAPVQVNNVSSTSSLTWQAEYFGGNVETDVTRVINFNSSDANIDAISRLEYWRISDDAGTTPTGTVSANIGLSWDSGSDVSANTTDHADLRVMIWDESNDEWDNLGGTSHSGDATFGRLVSGTAATFSEQIFTLGSTSMSNPLPVELISFTVEMQGQEALLQWETASERNNDFFEIQRSINGQDWNSLGFVEGAGDSSEPLSYAFTDEKPLYGVSYYRLHQVDFDGSYDYSKVISLENVRDELSLPDPEMLLFPNPATVEEVFVRVLHLAYGQPVEVKLSDAYGKVHLAEQLSAVALEEGVKLNPDLQLPAGIYVVSIKQGDTSIQQKLLIRK